MAVSEIVENPGRLNELRQILLRSVKDYKRFFNGAGLTDNAIQRQAKTKFFKSTPELK